MITGYRRPNGTVGIRNHVLALPSVVCANRVAESLAKKSPDIVSLEHPLGCAQIGSDKEQTYRTLVGMGCNPNVSFTIVAGLGCEGISADSVFQGIRDRGHLAALVTIQEAGGVESAVKQAFESYLGPSGIRETVGLDQIVLGIGPVAALGDMADHMIREFTRRGGRVVRAVGSRTPETLLYAQPVPGTGQYFEMASARGDGETVTGLAAAGCHLVLAQADPSHLGGNPVCPVVRIAIDPRLSSALADDIDGLASDRRPEEWVDFLEEVISGRMTASEVLRSNIFAIERVGPTL